MSHFVTEKGFSLFFVFSHFGPGISTWITFDFVIRIWWNLVLNSFGMIAKKDFNPCHWWRHYLVLYWCWNSYMKNCWLRCSSFGIIAKNDLINFKHPFLWHHHLVTVFLIIWYKRNITRDLSFVIIPLYSWY